MNLRQSKSMHFKPLLSLIILPGALMTAKAQTIKNIPFGKNDRIAYNLQSGTYSVWSGGKEVIKDAYAFYDETQQPDTGGAVRTFTVSPVKNGKQYVISNGSQKQQIFYVYNGAEGFYTTVTLKGKGAASRYMSPLSGKRTLFTSAVVVPFDNDAWVKYKVASLQRAAPVS